MWFSFSENLTFSGIPLGNLLSEHPELLGTAGDPAHPGISPILVKLLFTSERLSVQVHPDDAYAEIHHQSLGKTEAWYVLDSQSPGEIGAGIREPISRAQFKDSISSGAIERLLDWRPVHKGDLIFVPAGTVHAIGAGVTICEIQENSDITYRLYDYGRGRELHVEHGVEVARLGPHTDFRNPVPLGEGRTELAACPYFRIEKLQPTSSINFDTGLPYYAILVCTNGSGRFDGQPVRAGQAFFVPAHNTAFAIEAPASEWILTYKADGPADLQIR